MLQYCVTARNQRFALYNGDQQFGEDEDEIMVTDVWDEEADGRLAPQGYVYLLDHPNVPLYNFVTQSVAPMTEDMIMDHLQYLLNWTEQDRLATQLSSVTSDMQGFKAANPLGNFCDFVRWHSPKDWDSEKSCLSERFSDDGNLWVKCWEDARPLAAVNQPRLFDETAVAEEILCELENATLQNVAEWLLPSMVTCAAAHLIMKSAGLDKLVDAVQLKELCTKVITFDRESYQKLCDTVNEYEMLVSMYQAASEFVRSYAKRSEDIPAPTITMIHDIAIELVKKHKTRDDTSEHLVPWGIPIPGTFLSPMGSTIRQMISTRDPSSFDLLFPDIFRRYYTVRWNAVPPGRPSWTPKTVPQRLFICFGKEDFSVAASVTEDQ